MYSLAWNINLLQWGGRQPQEPNRDRGRQDTLLMSKKQTMANGLHWASGRGCWTIHDQGLAMRREGRTQKSRSCSPQAATLCQEQLAGEQHQQLPHSENLGWTTASTISIISEAHREEQPLRYLYSLICEILWGWEKEAQTPYLFLSPLLLHFGFFPWESTWFKSLLKETLLSSFSLQAYYFVGRCAVLVVFGSL